MSWRKKDTGVGRREIATMLMALEKQAREAAHLAEKAHRHASRDSYAGYFQFRAKVEEFQALIALIEERLARLESEHTVELTARFRQLDTVMLIMLVRTSTRFYGMLKENVALPLGARELFLPELRTLSDMRDRLMEEPEQAERMIPGVALALENALATVEALIERAPSLPDFNDQATQ
jgi:glutathione S-transferase